MVMGRSFIPRRNNRGGVIWGRQYPSWKKNSTTLEKYKQENFKRGGISIQESKLSQMNNRRGSI